VVGGDGVLPLPWLLEPLQNGLRRTAHALLVHGAQGVGQFELALTLAQAWLCEALAGSSSASRPCGICPACRLVQVQSHPDLLVLLPEALRETLGWAPAAGDGDDGSAEKTGKAKPSKEIKVEAVRAAIAFAQTTSARGRGKVVVLHPAERINAVASNMLLKTLEEPPGAARFVLSSAMPDALLPTIRSRCQSLPLGLPPTAVATDWLHARGVAEPAVLLAACGGQPLQALQWSEEGVDAGLWRRLPSLIRRREATPFLNWPLARFVDALQKLCHDALCVASGTTPRYFPADAIQTEAGIGALTDWAKSLNQIARYAEHPWSSGLLIEAMVVEAHTAVAPQRPTPRSSVLKSVHSDV
jgi:DNA polymerase-3 subunit delta'